MQEEPEVIHEYLCHYSWCLGTSLTQVHYTSLFGDNDYDII